MLTENVYSSTRLIDGKPRKVIVDENRKIVNRNPSKDELKGLTNGPYIVNFHQPKKYTDKELLENLKQFYEENGRPPTEKDFSNNPGYPNHKTYIKRFRTWPNALKLVESDVESMVKKGVLETNQQKARFTEMIVRDHFKKHPIDLAGENCISPCDGICPNGKTYDVKSSKFYKEKYYRFTIRNKYKEEIEIYYFLAFNSDWTKLEYGWRIPGEIAEKDNFIVGMYHAEFNVRNMEKYEITDKLIELIKEV